MLTNRQHVHMERVLENLNLLHAKNKDGFESEYPHILISAFDFGFQESIQNCTILGRLCS